MSEMPPPPERKNIFDGMPPYLKLALIGAGIFVVGGLAGWIGRGALAGPDDVPTMSIYQDWRLLCPATSAKDASCEMSEDVIDPASRQQLARIVLGNEVNKDKPKEKTLVLAVTVPLNVMLEPGLGIKIGGDDVKVYQYKTCMEDGCVSVVPVNKQMEKSLLGAQVASIAVVGRDGKPVDLPFSVKGIVDARRAFLNNDARRASWWWRLWS